MLNFNNLLKNNGQKSEESKRTPSGGAKPGERQIKFYFDLCKQKSVEPDENWEEWTVPEMSDQINKLLQMKKVILASSRQVETILNLSKQLGLPEPNVDIIRKLPIDKASDMIEKLIARTNADDKPTTRQLEMLADMFKCPDVLITDLIPVHPTLIKELEELTILHKKALNNKTKTTTYNNERVSLKELQDEIIKTKEHIETFIVNFDLGQLTKKEVSNFIQDYSERFYNWRDSRPSDEQKNFIRELQGRLSKIESWSINMDEIHANIDGSPTYDINSPVKDELILTGEHILTDDELNLFDKEQASQLIDMLLKELRSIGTQSSSNEKEIDDSIARSIVDISKANEKEQEKVLGMVHSLYAILGQEADAEILEDTNFADKLKDLIEICTIYVTPEAIYNTIDEFVQADALLNTLNIELELE